MLKIIYVGGYGRSGSTALDIFMGLNSEARSMGELCNFHHAVRGGNKCSCGQEVRDCEFWGPVSQAVGSDKCDPMDVLGGVYPKEWVIDSSKTTMGNFFRPLKSWMSADEFVFIHLIRHPYGVYASVLNGGNRQLLSGQGLTPSSWQLFYKMIHWLLANSVSFVMSKTVFRKCSLCLSYEEFLSDPSCVIDWLVRNSGLKARGQPAQDGKSHLISGNRMMYSSTRRLESVDAPERTSQGNRALLMICRSMYAYLHCEVRKQ